jgi:hypothetical protein
MIVVDESCRKQTVNNVYLGCCLFDLPVCNEIIINLKEKLKLSSTLGYINID